MKKYYLVEAPNGLSFLQWVAILLFGFTLFKMYAGYILVGIVVVIALWRLRRCE